MGFQVDLSALAAAEEKLRGLSKDGEGIADLASDADPEWYVWGLPGVVFAGPYFLLADKVHDHLKDMHESLNAHAERIRICADQYATKEEDNHATMTAIERKMGK